MNDRATGVQLRAVTASDLAVFFEHQLDPEANRMVAFTQKDPTDRAGFLARWEHLLEDDTITVRTVLHDGKVVGHVASYSTFGTPEVTYWIARGSWGQGIATEALTLFLQEMRRRPLHARVAKDNVASVRVLEKCGFQVTGEVKGFSAARNAEIEELVLELR